MTIYTVSLHNHLINPINPLYRAVEERQIRKAVHHAFKLGIDVLSITEKWIYQPMSDRPLRYIQSGNLGEAYKTHNFKKFSLIEYNGRGLYFVPGMEVFITIDLGNLGCRSGEIILIGFNPDLYKFWVGKGKKQVYTEKQKRETGSIIFEYLKSEHPFLATLPHPMDEVKGLGKEAGIKSLLEGIADTYEVHNSSFAIVKPTVNKEAELIETIIGKKGITGNDGLLSQDIDSSLTFVKVNGVLPPEELLQEIFNRIKIGELENKEGKISLQGILAKALNSRYKWKRLKHKT